VTRVLALDRDAIVWSAPELGRAGAPRVVLMHRYHRHESDWISSFDVLPEGVVGVSLRGPVPIGERWAWVDFNRGEGVGVLSAAARGVLSFLDELDAPVVGLVGWSQGGAMAAHLMRQRPGAFAAAAMVGGFVWELRAHQGIAALRPPVFAGMGEDDDVITRGMQRQSSRWLGEHTTLTEARYDGIGHELREPMVGDALRFVIDRLPR
jgi:phospholipase/carboxylesterase